MTAKSIVDHELLVHVAEPGAAMVVPFRPSGYPGAANCRGDIFQSPTTSQGLASMVRNAVRATSRSCTGPTMLSWGSASNTVTNRLPDLRCQ
eukprot:3589069-Pyramimonas_sp.AAC.1